MACLKSTEAARRGVPYKNHDFADLLELQTGRS
jgi:hypothetical protein